MNDQTCTSKLYSLKNAVFYTLMFCLVFGADKYIRDLINLHHPKEEVEGLLGYNVLLFAIVLLPTTYLLSLIKLHWAWRCFTPFMFTVITSCILSFFNLSDPINVYQMVALALFPIPGVIAAYIKFSAVNENNFFGSTAPLEAKIEWLKEESSYWRNLAIYGLTAFFTFLAFWCNYMWGIARTLLEKGYDERCIEGWYSIQAACFAVFVLVSPFYESICKSNHFKNMLLQLKETDAK